MKGGQSLVRVRNLCRSLASLWVPPQCPSCYVRVNAAGVCDDCFTLLLAEAPASETVLSLSQTGRLPQRDILLRAAGRYEGIWRNLVQSFKADPAPPLPDWVCRRFESLGRSGGEDPVLLPVPMHRVRRRERGVNPAEVLAEGLANILGWDLEVRALERVRYRRPLRGLSAGARKREMVAAIRIRPTVADRLRGRAVWIVDDVLTTGSTVDACFQACREADVSGTGAVVLAWAPLLESEPQA